MSGTVAILVQRGHLSCLASALCLLALGWPAAAGASEGVVVACETLSSEQRAQLEARIRASLLSAALEGNVTVECQARRAYVEVVTNGGSATLETPTTDTTLQEDLIGAVEAALHDLTHVHVAQPPSHRPEVDQTPPVVPPSSQRSPPPTDEAPSLTPREQPARVANVPPASLQVMVQGIDEYWSSRVALGGALGVARTAGRYWYAAKLGFMSPQTTGQAFALTEWHAALRAGVQPGWALGLQLSLGVGPSIVVLSHDANVASRSGTVVAAWFLDASLSRPIWFGSLALAPAVGTRFFASERGVRLDAREKLTLSGFVPQLSLNAVLRLE